MAEVGHLFKSPDFLGRYSNIGGFYIVADVGHPYNAGLMSLIGYIFLLPPT